MNHFAARGGLGVSLNFRCGVVFPPGHVPLHKGLGLTRLNERHSMREGSNMFASRRVGVISSFGLLTLTVLQGCPHPSVPDLSGTYIAHSAAIQADTKTEADILNSFKKAEDAVTRKDLDGVMDFYTESYKHRGFTKESLRAEWKHLFEEYRDFSTTHVLTRIVVETERVPPTAQVTCTGSLWAISNDTNQRVNIDSWYDEVHYLAYVNGVWRIRGHAWEMLNPKDTRTARPPHPFF